MENCGGDKLISGAINNICQTNIITSRPGCLSIPIPTYPIQLWIKGVLNTKNKGNSLRETDLLILFVSISIKVQNCVSCTGIAGF